eukprot:7191304-Pyramimonas_sp.AAC.1
MAAVEGFAAVELKIAAKRSRVLASKKSLRALLQKQLGTSTGAIGVGGVRAWAPTTRRAADAPA